MLISAGKMRQKEEKYRINKVEAWEGDAQLGIALYNIKCALKFDVQLFYWTSYATCTFHKSSPRR